jgi:hypothetical protein
MNRFSDACREFSLTISLKKTEMMGQNVDNPPEITISNYVLEVVHQFTYLGSTISDNREQRNNGLDGNTARA